MTQDGDWQAQLEETAYHEACHFVMGQLAKGGLPRRVCILPGPDYAGFCGGAPGMPAYAALVSLAGVYSEDVYHGLGDDQAQGDIEEAESELRQVYGEAWEPFFNQYQDFTYRLLSYTGPRRAIAAVASYLVDNPTLELEAVYPLYDLSIKAIGNRFRWLRGQVDAFLEEVTP